MCLIYNIIHSLTERGKAKLWLHEVICPVFRSACTPCDIVLFPGHIILGLPSTVSFCHQSPYFQNTGTHFKSKLAQPVKSTCHHNDFPLIAVKQLFVPSLIQRERERESGRISALNSACLSSVFSFVCELAPFRRSEMIIKQAV